MRLMNRDIHTFKVFKTQKIDSGYVGSSLKELEIGDVRCIVSPLSDKVSIEIYGERVTNMVEFTILKTQYTIISDGDILENNGRRYKVVSVMEYPEHYCIVGEKYE